MTEAAKLPGRPVWLGFLPDFLFETDASKARYIAKAWLLMLVPSLLLSAVVQALLPGAERPHFQLNGPGLDILLFILVVIGPLIETMMLIGPVLLLNRRFGPGPAVAGSALLWGILHSLQAPVWGLVIWWPFLIMSIAFLTWRSRGLGTAVLIVWALHGLQNSVAAILLLVLTATGALPGG